MKMYEHERKYLRVPCQQDVHLVSGSGMNLMAHSDNISAGGVEIICDRMTTQIIMPSGYQFDPENPIILSLKIDLGEGNIIHASCSVQNLRRLSQDSFGLNLKFKNLERQNGSMLESFVGQHHGIA